MRVIKGLALFVELEEGVVLRHNDVEIVIKVIDCGVSGVKLLFAAPQSVLIIREKLIKELEKCKQI